MYKETDLLNETFAGIETEILFQVASERASGVQLLKLNIEKGSDDKRYLRRLSGAVRALKKMKARDAIQFFATPESFEASTQEAQFLINKYPHVFDEVPSLSDYGFLYIKI